MKKLFTLNNIRTYLLVIILFLAIHLIYFIVFPQEVFAMQPDEAARIMKCFNPDTYIRHELDGTPIYEYDRYESNRYKNCSYNNRETYHLNDDHYPKIQELDSKPICEIDSYPNCYLDPTSHRYVLYGNPVDNRTLQGKLRYDLEKSKQLSETVRNRLYNEAKLKQKSCGHGHVVYHKKVIDLPKT